MRGAFIPFANTDSYIKTKVTNARTPEDISSLKTEIISQVNEGKISPEDAQRVSDTIDKYVAINSKIPASVENREQAVDLIEQKDDLKQAATDKLNETKVVDEAFHPQIQQEATALLNRANELNQEITGQPSEPAKHSMYADPLELPELKEQITDIQRRIDLGGADGEKAKLELTEIKTDPAKFYENRKDEARNNLTNETELNKALETYDNIINKIKQYDKENESGLSGEVGVGEKPIEAQPVEGRGAQEISGGRDIQAQGIEGEGKGVEGKVGEEVKPIKQLGTGANVYFETNKYRVNDNLKNGKILLNVGDAKSETPLANVEFDSPNEAVFVAKKLEENAPEGLISDFHNVDKIIENYKKEFKLSEAELPKQKTVEQLRAEEQKELDTKIPNAEQYRVDGKVDRTKLTNEADKKAFDEVYDKYDKSITLLLKEAEAPKQEGVGEKVAPIEEVKKFILPGKFI
jgi:hypothetical protein